MYNLSFQNEYVMIWSQNEINILNDLYPDISTEKIAEILGRSLRSVYGQAGKLGLRKSEDYIYNELKVNQANRLRIVGVSARFKKGIKPWNKGIKPSDDTLKKLSSTWFKPGSIPSNAKYDGYERINVEGYTEVRISMGKFVLKHRLVYEQHYGQIPPGKIVTFADGNKQNFDINNLNLIDRAQHCNNNTIHRYPPEIKSLIRVQSKLQKTIAKCQETK